MSELVAGQPASDFTGESTQGTVNLAERQGHKVVLYFYPRDNTPGCTTEAGDFRDAFKDFEASGCQIIGVSRDTMTSHDKFSKKLDLPFPLVADPQEEICNLYGVMKEKTMYGKRVRTIERSTFLIDEKGVLREIWRGVKVPGHVQAVLQAVRELG